MWLEEALKLQKPQPDDAIVITPYDQKKWLERRGVVCRKPLYGLLSRRGNRHAAHHQPIVVATMTTYSS